MRGEYAPVVRMASMMVELPPRARRILPELAKLFMQLGTTSACAENTLIVPSELAASRNYLRVRGEYRGLECLEKTPMELPPRARRILYYSLHTQRNYLRVRGEYIMRRALLIAGTELPPRARRIRITERHG